MESIEDVQSEIVRAGHAYWQSVKGERALPSRRDFDPPLEVPRLIPHIIIFDVLQEPLVQHATPRFVRPPYVGPHKDFLFIEAVILPCGADRMVDKLLVFADFVRALRPR